MPRYRRRNCGTVPAIARARGSRSTLWTAFEVVIPGYARVIFAVVLPEIEIRNLRGDLLNIRGVGPFQRSTIASSSIVTLIPRKFQTRRPSRTPTIAFSGRRMSAESAASLFHIVVSGDSRITSVVVLPVVDLRNKLFRPTIFPRRVFPGYPRIILCIVLPNILLRCWLRRSGSKLSYSITPRKSWIVFAIILPPIFLRNMLVTHLVDTNVTKP